MSILCNPKDRQAHRTQPPLGVLFGTPLLPPVLHHLRAMDREIPRRANVFSCILRLINAGPRSAFLSWAQPRFSANSRRRQRRE